MDLPGLSFPRRLGFRLKPEYIKKYHLLGAQCDWQAYKDENFTKKIQGDFTHSDIINRAGWSRFYFKGIFEQNTVYLKCEIKNPKTSQLIKNFYFKFTKTYQTTLSGKTYIKDPILGDKIVNGGVLVELVEKLVEKEGEKEKKYIKGNTMMDSTIIKNTENQPVVEKYETKAIMQYMTDYSEKPKIVFLITPPHLTAYAKLLLILIKQLVDVNFDQAYVTKDNQKPLYKTRYILDELGNLQSEGHGIDSFQTMLSIGLGQDQQFTLILQTLQQLKDVYGDSVDKIVQGNTNNIIFLKSNDDQMLETLEKLSGKTHKVFRNSKSIQYDTGNLIKGMSSTDSKVQYTMSTQEVPVISFNDMLFITPRNSMVFRPGDSPIWNKNELSLPMSWRLLKNDIKHYGHNYTFQTIPTLSSAKDFDVRKNQPNFEKMLEKKMSQALHAEDAKGIYASVYNYDDYDIQCLDPDEYSKDIMSIIYTMIQHKDDVEVYNPADEMELNEQTVNQPVVDAIAKSRAEFEKDTEKKYANGSLSSNDIYSKAYGKNDSYRDEIIKAFKQTKGYFEKDTKNFCFKDGTLYASDGKTKYIVNIRNDAKQDQQIINDAMRDDSKRVFSEQTISQQQISDGYSVTEEFYKWLSEQDDWQHFASGQFDEHMARLLKDM